MKIRVIWDLDPSLESRLSNFMFSYEKWAFAYCDCSPYDAQIILEACFQNGTRAFVVALNDSVFSGFQFQLRFIERRLFLAPGHASKMAVDVSKFDRYIPSDTVRGLLDRLRR